MTLRQRINELSKGKLHAYISQAVQSYGDAKADLRTDAKADKLRHKATIRYVGIDRAVSRIAKRVPANEVKTYVRSPWRSALGTSSAVGKPSGIKPLAATLETDEPKNTSYTYDAAKSIAAAKERLKFRGKRRRFYGGEETTNEADIIQQVAGVAIKAGVKGLRRLISGPGKIRAGRVKPIKKTTSVAPQSNPPQTVKPSNPPLNQGPWGERPFGNSPPHIKQSTVETPSTSGGINPSNKMSGSDFRALIAKNPKLKIGAGKK